MRRQMSPKATAAIARAHGGGHDGAVAAALASLSAGSGIGVCSDGVLQAPLEHLVTSARELVTPIAAAGASEAQASEAVGDGALVQVHDRLARPWAEGRFVSISAADAEQCFPEGPAGGLRDEWEVAATAVAASKTARSAKRQQVATSAAAAAAAAAKSGDAAAESQAAVAAAAAALAEAEAAEADKAEEDSCRQLMVRQPAKEIIRMLNAHFPTQPVVQAQAAVSPQAAACLQELQQEQRRRIEKITSERRELRRGDSGMMWPPSAADSEIVDREYGPIHLRVDEKWSPISEQVRCERRAALDGDANATFYHATGSGLGVAPVSLSVVEKAMLAKHGGGVFRRLRRVVCLAEEQSDPLLDRATKGELGSLRSGELLSVDPHEPVMEMLADSGMYTREELEGLRREMLLPYEAPDRDRLPSRKDDPQWLTHLDSMPVVDNFLELRERADAVTTVRSYGELLWEPDPRGHFAGSPVPGIAASAQRTLEGMHLGSDKSRPFLGVARDYFNPERGAAPREWDVPDAETNLRHMILLDGPRGTGKSAILNHVVYYARKSDWIVVFVPNGYDHIGRGAFVRPSPMHEGLFDSPLLARQVLQNLLAAHKDKLVQLPIQDPARLARMQRFFERTQKRRMDLVRTTDGINFTGDINAFSGKRRTLIKLFRGAYVGRGSGTSVSAGSSSHAAGKQASSTTATVKRTGSSAKTPMPTMSVDDDGSNDAMGGANEGLRTKETMGPLGLKEVQTLADLAQFGVEDVNVAGSALVELLAELREVDKFPVMFAIDEVNAWNAPFSKFFFRNKVEFEQATHVRQLRPYELGLVAAMMGGVSVRARWNEFNRLKRGVVVGATSYRYPDLTRVDYEPAALPLHFKLGNFSKQEYMAWVQHLRFMPGLDHFNQAYCTLNQLHHLRATTGGNGGMLWREAMLWLSDTNTGFEPWRDLATHDRFLKARSIRARTIEASAAKVRNDRLKAAKLAVAAIQGEEDDEEGDQSQEDDDADLLEEDLDDSVRALVGDDNGDPEGLLMQRRIMRDFGPTPDRVGRILRKQIAATYARKMNKRSPDEVAMLELKRDQRIVTVTQAYETRFRAMSQRMALLRKDFRLKHERLEPIFFPTTSPRTQEAAHVATAAAAATPASPPAMP
jgi:hypothetical protein